MVVRTLVVVIALTGASISNRACGSPWPGLVVGLIFGACIVWADKI